VGRGLSIYLDFLRVMASVLVVLYHFVGWPHFGVAVNAVNVWGHEATIVFFVLSGFVIRHAVTTKDLTVQDFAASRFSRFYSAIIPCLVLTMLFDYAGAALAPEHYARVNMPDRLLEIFAKLYISLLMLNQSWISKDFYTNAAYWSICYEAWFYVLFAVYHYATPRQRLLVGGGAALLAGPRILVMFPLWLIGAFAYSERTTVLWSRSVVWLTLLQPIAVLWVYVHCDLRQLGVALIGLNVASQLEFSGYLLTDALLAASLALHFAAAKHLDQPLLRVFGPVERVIAFAAARSFTLYLLHLPTMFLLSAMSAAWLGDRSPWLVGIGTFALPLLLAPWIEEQRHTLRPWIKQRLLARWPLPRPNPASALSTAQ
jgi:peptidoglycan/LPS O-acetylase OafA/YrhL